MKRYVLILTTVLLSLQLHAGIFDTLSIGFGGGYDSYNTLRGEIYLKSEIQFLHRKTEIKAGLNNRSYQLTFDSVSGLNASSIGIFADIVMYPFHNGLFAGFRYELMNFNWLSDASKTKIQTERNYVPTSMYTGSCFFLQVGYNFRIFENVGIKLYAQPGMQQFEISNGSSSIGSTTQTGSTAGLVIENHYEFIYNVNLSLEFRIK